MGLDGTFAFPRREVSLLRRESLHRSVTSASRQLAAELLARAGDVLREDKIKKGDSKMN